MVLHLFLQTYSVSWRTQNCIVQLFYDNNRNAVSVFCTISHFLLLSIQLASLLLLYVGPDLYTHAILNRSQIYIKMPKLRDITCQFQKSIRLSGSFLFSQYHKNFKQNYIYSRNPYLKSFNNSWNSLFVNLFNFDWII